MICRPPFQKRSQEQPVLNTTYAVCQFRFTLAPWRKEPANADRQAAGARAHNNVCGLRDGCHAKLTFLVVPIANSVSNGVHATLHNEWLVDTGAESVARGTADMSPTMVIPQLKLQLVFNNRSRRGLTNHTRNSGLLGCNPVIGVSLDVTLCNNSVQRLTE